MSAEFTVLAPAYYRDLGPVHYLARSAAIHGVDVRWYGVGKSYGGWWQIQVLDLLDELDRVETSHVLYTDARDAILTAGMEAIGTAYEEAGEPSLLLSVEHSGVNAGGWLGRTDVAKIALRSVREMHHQTWDPQERWRELVYAARVPARLDVASAIFHVVEGPIPDPIPPILHFAGGYMDPKTGRAERMEPVWRALYGDNS